MMLIWAFDYLKATNTVSKKPIEIDTTNYSEVKSRLLGRTATHTIFVAGSLHRPEPLPVRDKTPQRTSRCTH